MPWLLLTLLHWQHPKKCQSEVTQSEVTQSEVAAMIVFGCLEGTSIYVYSHMPSDCVRVLVSSKMIVIAKLLLRGGTLYCPVLSLDVLNG